jgi:hypothetical protein
MEEMLRLSLFADYGTSYQLNGCDQDATTYAWMLQVCLQGTGTGRVHAKNPDRPPLPFHSVYMVSILRMLRC